MKNPPLAGANTPKRIRGLGLPQKSGLGGACQFSLNEAEKRADEVADWLSFLYFDEDTGTVGSVI
jgi:hypothetical protein